MKPETVVGWHRAGFRLYWRWRSRPRGGRTKVSVEIRTLIRRMAAENAGWGAPKIHGELLKLGVEVSERTVARYLQRLRRRGDPAKQWLAFLANHRDVNDRRLRLLYRTHADIASPGSWGAVALVSVNVPSHNHPASFADSRYNRNDFAPAKRPVCAVLVHDRAHFARPRQSRAILMSYAARSSVKYLR